MYPTVLDMQFYIWESKLNGVSELVNLYTDKSFMIGRYSIPSTLSSSSVQSISYESVLH